MCKLLSRFKNRIKKAADSDKAKTIGTTLEVSLRLLEAGSSVCPPLKSALAVLIGCLDIIQVGVFLASLLTNDF